jgi:RNA polymerase sigma-70 factor, ECF subfamily
MACHARGQSRARSRVDGRPSAGGVNTNVRTIVRGSRRDQNGTFLREAGFRHVINASPSAQPSAFDEYVVPEIPVMYRVALSLTGQPSDAEDLVQDALIRAYQAIDRFDGAHPRAWLLTILRHTHLNRVRKRSAVLLADGDGVAQTMDRLGTAVPGAEEVVVNDMFEAVVARAMDDLPDKHRRVIQLVDIDGLSYQDAADSLGVPRGTVMSRLHRGRKRIRSRLDDAGVTPRGRTM